MQQDSPPQPLRPNQIDWTTQADRVLTCPVCATSGPKAFVLSAEASWYASTRLALFSCPGCACKFFPDLTSAPYEVDTGIAGPLKYVEVGAGVDLLATPV